MSQFDQLARFEALVSEPCPGCVAAPCPHAQTRPVYAFVAAASCGQPPVYLNDGQPVGFTCTSCSAWLPVSEPLLWEGDQA